MSLRGGIFVSSLFQGAIRMHALSQETASGVALFESDGWTLTTSGLEHDNGYFIPRDEIRARRSDGLWVWPVQMAEKLWCAPRAFAEAFRRAIVAFAIEPDDALARSRAVLRDRAPGASAGSGHGFVPVGIYADTVAGSVRPRTAVEIETDRDDALAPRRAA
jgi:hypothetical protein